MKLLTIVHQSKENRIKWKNYFHEVAAPNYDVTSKDGVWVLSKMMANDMNIDKCMLFTIPT